MFLFRFQAARRLADRRGHATAESTTADAVTASAVQSSPVRIRRSHSVSQSPMNMPTTLSSTIVGGIVAQFTYAAFFSSTSSSPTNSPSDASATREMVPFRHSFQMPHRRRTRLPPLKGWPSTPREISMARWCRRRVCFAICASNFQAAVLGGRAASACASVPPLSLNSQGCLLLRLPYWRQPVGPLRYTAANDCLEVLRETSGEWPDRAVADGTPINRAHRRDLRARPAEKDLFGHVQLGKPDRPFHDWDVEILASKSDEALG